MARFASGVTVVAARDEGEDVLMTASAFVSVSLEPPLVLVSLGTRSRLAGVLRTQPCWTVSMLSAGQRPIAARFSTRDRPSDRLLLAGLEHHRSPLSGTVLFDRAVATVECRTQQLVQAGDHVLAIGLVVATELGDRAARPLLYVDRAYHTPS